ncbi:MAG: hypothetical protein M1561_00185 [Gammaproteobacteria bacterium]|nr:hypothetical protein [Gammaproteobacteria bacterium]
MSNTGIELAIGEHQAGAARNTGLAIGEHPDGYARDFEDALLPALISIIVQYLGEENRAELLNFCREYKASVPPIDTLYVLGGRLRDLAVTLSMLEKSTQHQWYEQRGLRECTLWLPITLLPVFACIFSAAHVSAVPTVVSAITGSACISDLTNYVCSELESKGHNSTSVIPDRIIEMEVGADIENKYLAEFFRYVVLTEEKMRPMLLPPLPYVSCWCRESPGAQKKMDFIYSQVKRSLLTSLRDLESFLMFFFNQEEKRIQQIPRQSRNVAFFEAAVNPAQIISTARMTQLSLLEIGMVSLDLAICALQARIFGNEDRYNYCDHSSQILQLLATWQIWHRSYDELICSLLPKEDGRNVASTNTNVARAEEFKEQLQLCKRAEACWVMHIQVLTNQLQTLSDPSSRFYRFINDTKQAATTQLRGWQQRSAGVGTDLQNISVLDTGITYIHPAVNVHERCIKDKSKFFLLVEHPLQQSKDENTATSLVSQENATTVASSTALVDANSASLSGKFVATSLSMASMASASATGFFSSTFSSTSVSVSAGLEDPNDKVPLLSSAPVDITQAQDAAQNDAGYRR